METGANYPDKYREGPLAKAIESQTARLPSDVFLLSAIGSMALSATLQILGKKEQSNFVGQWAPTLLILGLYNKLVKVAGSEAGNIPSEVHRSHGTERVWSPQAANL